MKQSFFIIAIALLLLFLSPVAAADWEDVDTWETTIGGGGWSTVEAWVTTLGVESPPPVYGWEDVTTWTTTISTVTGSAWIDVDTWETTITSVATPVTPSSLYDFSISFQNTLTYSTLASADANYSIAQNTVNNWWNTTFSLTIGQTTGAFYSIYRSFLPLDLTELTQEFSEASIYATGSIDASTTDFNVCIVEGTQTDILGDNTSFNGYNTTILGSWNTSSFLSTTRGIKIDFNSAGIAFLNANLGNEVVLCLISEEDLNASAPTDSEKISLKNVLESDTEKRPILYYNTVGGTVWTDVETWNTTIEIDDVEEPGPGEEPADPLIPINTLVQLMLPIALLFSPAVILASRFGATGFILGLAIGLFTLWTTGFVSLGIVVLGGLTIAAVYSRID